MVKEWMVADGDKDFLNNEDFLKIIKQFEERLAEHNIVVKVFEHDANLAH